MEQYQITHILLVKMRTALEALTNKCPYDALDCLHALPADEKAHDLVVRKKLIFIYLVFEI